ncbi:MAG: hypothetical protein ACOZB3_13020 [Calditrichota bacterium]
MKKFFYISLIAAALLLIAGCAKPPEVEMNAAGAAIEAARTAEAETYAPQAYKMAMDTLNAAKAAKVEADGKFALFRSYTTAKNLFVSAQALGQKAAGDAAAEKERVKAQVADMMAQCAAALATADSALAKAPVGKGNKADIELIKNDLTAINNAFADAQKDNDAGKYAIARTKFDNVMKRAMAIQQEIANAAARKNAPKKR